MNGIDIAELTYAYDGASGPSLDGVTLAIEPGTCVLLAGPSGSGKSTLLNCINGLNPLHYGGERSGSVRVAEREVANMPLWEIAGLVGTVFQNPNTQFFQCNVEDELAFGMEYRGFTAEEISRRIERYAERMRISRLLHRDIFSVSSGERQKVAVAAVAALEQDVLLFDEPSANLDSEATRDLAEVLHGLKAEGRTIVISEHRIHYLRSLIDRVIVLDTGTIRYDGSPDMLNDAEFRRAYGLRSWSYADLAAPSRHNAGVCSFPLLHASDLALRRGRATPILKAASLCVGSGECVGISGPNGAGKTTMSRILAGLEPRATGTVILDGEALSAKARLGKIVYMPQQADQQLFADTVHEEIATSFRRCPNADEAAREALRGFDLEHLADKHPHALSGGEKQRVAIAAMVAMRPQTLILDEPTSGMDGRRMLQFAREIRKLLATGCSLLIVTHDFELMVECCDRVIWVEDGRTDREYGCNDLGSLTEWFSCPAEERKAEVCSR